MNARIEARRTPRYSCDGSIEFGSQVWYTFAGKILNLSQGGCSIRPDRPTGYTVGESLHLRFEVNTLTFLVECIIRRVAPDGTLGVQILSLSDRTRKHLQELIEELESEEPESTEQETQEPPATR